MLTAQNAKGHAVLAILCLKLEGEFADYHVEPYVNGREQGYFLRALKYRPGEEARAVAFSQTRSGDGIVAYAGHRFAFNEQGNTPSDELYERRRLFEGYAYDQAAQALADYLRDGEPLFPDYLGSPTA